MDMFRIYSPVSRQLIIIGSRLECPWEMALWSKYTLLKKPVVYTVTHRKSPTVSNRKIFYGHSP